jgi:hypothetical protein
MVLKIEKKSGQNLGSSTSKQLLQIDSHVLEHLMRQNIIGGWINKKELMRFFDYGATQLREIEPHLKCAKVGRRKFYHVESIERLLNNNCK